MEHDRGAVAFDLEILRTLQFEQRFLGEILLADRAVGLRSVEAHDSAAAFQCRDSGPADRREVIGDSVACCPEVLHMEHLCSGKGRCSEGDLIAEPVACVLGRRRDGDFITHGKPLEPGLEALRCRARSRDQGLRQLARGHDRYLDLVSGLHLHPGHTDLIVARLHHPVSPAHRLAGKRLINGADKGLAWLGEGRGGVCRFLGGSCGGRKTEKQDTQRDQFLIHQREGWRISCNPCACVSAHTGGSGGRDPSRRSPGDPHSPCRASASCPRVAFSPPQTSDHPRGR